MTEAIGTDVGKAFRRVRKQRGDKIMWLAASLHTSLSMVYYVECGKRRLPREWLSLLPREYLDAIVPIMVTELESHQRRLKAI